MANKKKSKKTVATIKHDDDKRTNIPTAELQSVVADDQRNPIRVAYERRNRDLDPQLVWRGKDEQDWSDLVVGAPPLYIQEKVHPKVLIDDLLKRTKQSEDAAKDALQMDLFADFNGLSAEARSTEFYQHEANWTNRMILGDSLQVMASLAEREGLRGKVQCIYIDPPYGIKFNSNFQWSTTSRDVKDGKGDHITREPEQVKAFRDTWRDGIHSYLTYLRDRLTVARDLLCDSGSIFVQIGDENVHFVRAIMDELFGSKNCVALIQFTKTSSASSELLAGVADYILWYAKNIEGVKYRQLFRRKRPGEEGATKYDAVEDARGNRRLMTREERRDPADIPSNLRVYTVDQLTSQRPPGSDPFSFHGETFVPVTGYWKTSVEGLNRLAATNRVVRAGNRVRYVRYLDDFAVFALNNVWTDTGSVQSRADPKVYVVQSATSIAARCILMATDPGDLVLDPTCGSGTTAYVAEQWGRRWITMDTSRVALALARARIMGARYPYYLLADSRDGQLKEAEVTRSAPPDATQGKTWSGNIRQGFIYERVPHITLKSIANNAEIDVIWDKFQLALEPLREQLNEALGTCWEEWEIPRDLDAYWEGEAPAEPQSATDASKETARQEPRPPKDVAKQAKQLHADWWKNRIARQNEIDASIAAKADSEYLYDKPYEDKTKVRVAGPFTVESLSPHRVMGVDEDDELIDHTSPPRKQGRNASDPSLTLRVTDGATSDAQPAIVAENSATFAGATDDFAVMVMQNLKTSGVQQTHKEDKVTFTSITGWPGNFICAEGRYVEGNEESGTEKRAGIFIGPEFGTVSRPDLVAAAREAGDAGFDVVIACAFNFDAHSAEFDKLGRIPVLKARMNADLHMADDLKNTGQGNLFVIFGEPDIEILDSDNDQIQLKINGVDVFHPQTGEVRSDGAEGIACWFIDTEYNEESFFVRHAYFLGANDPYKSLKTTLKAEIDQDAWSTLNSDTSRPFNKPKTGRIAVKVINHLGDEVMKVFRVD